MRGIEPPGVREVETRHGTMFVLEADRFVGRSLLEYGEWCEGEIALLRLLLDPGDVVVDAGANLGAHTLAFARSVGPSGRVHAFEPQPLLAQLLASSLTANGLTNVKVHAAALGAEAGWLGLPRIAYDQPGNFGGLALADTPGGTERTPIHRLDDALLPARLKLLKIDVEGMELAVLRGAESLLDRARPALYVENDRYEKSPALVDHLWTLGYDAWWHVVPLFSEDNHRGRRVDVFGGVVSCNLLALPREHGADFRNLRRVEQVDEHPFAPREAPRAEAGARPPPETEA